MELLGIELRDKERDADEIKTYKLILKRFGDGNLAAKARDKIGNYVPGSNKYNDL